MFLLNTFALSVKDYPGHDALRKVHSRRVFAEVYSSDRRNRIQVLHCSVAEDCHRISLALASHNPNL
jgi:hypothetical protein